MKRTKGKPAVVKFAKYSESRDPEKYYYSMLRLFLPHYHEEQLKPPTFVSYQEFYERGSVVLTDGELPKQVKCIVDENKARFDCASNQLTQAFELLQTHGPLQDAWSLVAPQTEQDRLDELADIIDQSDIGNDGIPELNDSATPSTSLCSVELTSEATIQPLLMLMNTKQKEVFYSVRQWALEKAHSKGKQPFFLHVTGGAGVGKSLLIKCIYYEITKILKDRSNPQDPSVLLTAPTGTAAFTVGGYTIHSALKVPRKLPNCPSEIKDLAPDQANTLQVKLSNLQLLIIDEVSMVNRRVFHCIHKRLRQIKRIPISDKTAYFGNVAILAVGDMYQLPPVKAHPLVIRDQKQSIDMWHDLFTLVELDEIMRQKHDQTFAEALNRLRTHKKKVTLSTLQMNCSFKPETTVMIFHLMLFMYLLQMHRRIITTTTC